MDYTRLGGERPQGRCPHAGREPAGERNPRGHKTPTDQPNAETASDRITTRIQELDDWREETLAHVRRLIHVAIPDILEEWKWEKPTSSGTPVWSHDCGVCTGEAYRQVVKLAFFRGASLDDPARLLNSSLEGNTRRAIDLREGEKIDEVAFGHFIRAAVVANATARAARKKSARDSGVVRDRWGIPGADAGQMDTGSGLGRRPLRIIVVPDTTSASGTHGGWTEERKDGVSKVCSHRNLPSPPRPN